MTERSRAEPGAIVAKEFVSDLRQKKKRERPFKWIEGSECPYKERMD